MPVRPHVSTPGYLKYLVRTSHKMAVQFCMHAEKLFLTTLTFHHADKSRNLFFTFFLESMFFHIFHT